MCGCGLRISGKSDYFQRGELFAWPMIFYLGENASKSQTTTTTTTSLAPCPLLLAWPMAFCLGENASKSQTTTMTPLLAKPCVEQL
jgi:hypothetical protein